MGPKGRRRQEAKGRVMGNVTPEIADGFFPAIGDELGDGLGETLRARVKAELEPGERLLWASRSAPPPAPMSVAFFIWGAIALLVFFFGTVALLAGVQRTRWIDDNSPTLPGVLMDTVSGIIIICLIGHLVSKRIERRGQAEVCYAITDRRAIAWIPEPQGAGIRVKSLSRGRIKDLARVERPDGSGTLEFRLPAGEIDPFDREMFNDIPEVRRVEQIVRHHLIASETTT